MRQQELVALGKGLKGECGDGGGHSGVPVPQLGSSTEPKPGIPQTPAGQVLQGPSLRAGQPNWALINPSLALIPVSEPSSPPVARGGTGALLALPWGVEGSGRFRGVLEGSGGMPRSARDAQKCQGCSEVSGITQHRRDARRNARAAGAGSIPALP